MRVSNQYYFGGKIKMVLDYNTRLKILEKISLDKSFAQTRKELGLNKTTVYYELTKHSFVEPGLDVKISNGPNCLYRTKCLEKNGHTCGQPCKKYRPWICPKLREWPFVCNFCEKYKDENKKSCHYSKRIYKPEDAYNLAKIKARTSHIGFRVKPKVIDFIKREVSPLIKENRHSVEVAMFVAKASGVSTRQVRNWIDNNKINVGRIDLRNAVTRRTPKVRTFEPIKYKDPLMKLGHTYEEYLDFMQKHGKYFHLEVDTVIGKITDGKSILTIHIPEIEFQLYILLPHHTSYEVNQAFIDIQKKLGLEDYKKLFKVILCDNGTEFDKFLDIRFEKETGEELSKIFYTRPYRSGDKGSCERNHEFFRLFYKKGLSFENITQIELNEISSQINSYPRASLNFKSPAQLFVEKFGLIILRKLGLVLIEAKKVKLSK